MILDKEIPVNWPDRGEIVFDNVTLRYNAESEPVIKNLNLRIPAGQKVSNPYYLALIDH